MSVCVGRPRPPWSAIGCAGAIRSDGRLVRFFSFPRAAAAAAAAVDFFIYIKKNPRCLYRFFFFTWAREPQKKRNKSTWNINQVRQAGRGPRVSARQNALLDAPLFFFFFSLLSKYKWEKTFVCCVLLISALPTEIDKALEINFFSQKNKK